MSYYGRGRYRSWRSRGRRYSSGPSKYIALTGLFGSTVGEIRDAFMNLAEDARDELFSDYGAIHGEPAEKYARKTFPKWRSGTINLSDQTMERLMELVPPYLSTKQRYSLMQAVLKLHKKSGTYRTIHINVKYPAHGFTELQQALTSMSHDDVLAHLPEKVMKAATWLYDDDITAARAMLAEVERIENDLIRSQATREIELLRTAISSGKVQSAIYSVEMPAGKLNVMAFTPSFSLCFVATVCFGENAQETTTLRLWRDQYLRKKVWGKKFIVWYYNNGEKIADLVSRSLVSKTAAKICIRIFIKLFVNKLE